MNGVINLRSFRIEAIVDELSEIVPSLFGTLVDAKCFLQQN